jgi:hypothetical protein
MGYGTDFRRILTANLLTGLAIVASYLGLFVHLSRAAEMTGGGSGIVPIGSTYNNQGVAVPIVGTGFLASDPEMPGHLFYITTAHATQGDSSTLSIEGKRVGNSLRCRVVNDFYDVEIGDLGNSNMKAFAQFKLPFISPDEGGFVADPARLKMFLGVDPAQRAEPAGKRYINVETAPAPLSRAFALKTPWSRVSETEAATARALVNRGQELQAGYSVDLFPISRFGGSSMDSEALRRNGLSYNLFGGTISAPVTVGRGQSGGPLIKWDQDSQTYQILGIDSAYSEGRTESLFASHQVIFDAVKSLYGHINDGSCAAGAVFHVNPNPRARETAQIARLWNGRGNPPSDLRLSFGRVKLFSSIPIQRASTWF